jgi:hypothetical protein
LSATMTFISPHPRWFYFARHAGMQNPPKVRY